MLACALLLGVASQLFAPLKPAFHAVVASCGGLALFLYCLQPTVAEAMQRRAIICAVGLPVVAWLTPHVWLLYALMIAWVPFVAGRFAPVVPVYLFSLLLLPGLDDVGAIGSIKLFDFGVQDALALGAAAAVFGNTAKGKSRLAFDAPVLGAMLLLTGALARETTLTNFMRFTINVGLDLWLPYYILSRGIRSLDALREAMLWLGCGAATLSAILLYEAWKAWPIYNILYTQYGLSTLLMVKARGGVLRSGGPFVEPTSAAMVLAICIVALWLSRGYFRSGWSYAGITLATLIGLSAPQSRGAWIGLLIALAVTQLFCGRYARVALGAVSLAIVGPLLLLIAQFSPYVAETLGLTGGSSATSEYRRQLLARGMEEFWHSPIFGFSMPEVTRRLSDLRQGEGIVDFVNTYIWILLISGAVGATIFFGTFVYFLVRLLPLHRPVEGLAGSVSAAAFVFAGIVMPIEMLFFTSFGGRPAVFVFAMFGFAAAIVSIRDRQRNHARRSSDEGIGDRALAASVR